MPSHQERVRRNYHTVESTVCDIRREDMIQVNVALTRHEIASWMSPYSAAQAMSQRLFREVLDLFHKAGAR